MFKKRNISEQASFRSRKKLCSAIQGWHHAACNHHKKSIAQFFFTNILKYLERSVLCLIPTTRTMFFKKIALLASG